MKAASLTAACRRYQMKSWLRIPQSELELKHLEIKPKQAQAALLFCPRPGLTF
jgi:hypothetical protein